MTTVWNPIRYQLLDRTASVRAPAGEPLRRPAGSDAGALLPSGAGIGSTISRRSQAFLGATVSRGSTVPVRQLDEIRLDLGWASDARAAAGRRRKAGPAL